MSMTGSLQDVIQAWGVGYAGLSLEEIDRRVLGHTAMVRAIAEEGSFTPASFSARTGLPLERVPELFRGLASSGLEMDAEGNMIGAALTRKPTPHHFRVNGQELYAWCSLDTLFLPGLLDEDAEVSSTCPVSGEPIQLRITPEAIVSHSPQAMVLSIVVPGADGPDIGPASPT